MEKPWKVVQNASNSSPAADNRFDLPRGTAACWDGPECSFRISGCEGRREACSAHNGRTKGDLTACRAAPTLRCRSLGRGLPSWLGVSTGFLQSCCRRLMRDHAATGARQGVALAACRHEAHGDSVYPAEHAPERYVLPLRPLSHLVEACHGYF